MNNKHLSLGGRGAGSGGGWGRRRGHLTREHSPGTSFETLAIEIIALRKIPLYNSVYFFFRIYQVVFEGLPSSLTNH